MRYHTEECAEFNKRRGIDFLCQCQPGTKTDVCNKKPTINFDRPVQVRSPYANTSYDVRPAKILQREFIDRRGTPPGTLVMFKCGDGSDTVMVFDDSGYPISKLHSGVGGYTLENVPSKKTFYLYEDIHPNGYVTHWMRSEVRHPASKGKIGVLDYRLLKEVEVDL